MKLILFFFQNIFDCCEKTEAIKYFLPKKLILYIHKVELALYLYVYIELKLRENMN